MIERAVGLVKGHLRAMQLTLERFVKAKIPPKHPIMWWLVRHVAHVRLLRARGQDGKTAYQRSRGVESNVKMVHFGELCRYKCRAQEPGVAGTKARWSQGVWLGIEQRSNQNIVFDIQHGIQHARTIKRFPNEQKWPEGVASRVHLTPHSGHVAAEPGVFEEAQPRPEQQMQPDPSKNIRRLYISKADL